MANSAQAKKRVRQLQKRELHNASQRSRVRTAVKKVLKLVQSDAKAAEVEMKVATRLIDKAAKHNIIHENKAARIKSRLTKKLRLAASA